MRPTNTPGIPEYLRLGMLRIRYHEGLRILLRVFSHLTSQEQENSAGLAIADAYRALYLECREIFDESGKRREDI